MYEILGWRRENGDFGIRNHVIVLSSVACANNAVLEIARRTGAIPVIHNQGACGMFSTDREQFVRTIVNIGSHPNVAFTLVVGLGCEGVDAHKIADMISKRGREAESLLIQEEGLRKTIEKGVRIIEKAKESLEPRKDRGSFEDLIIGVKCGASDYSSGLVSNPVVGKVVDFMIDNGATVMFGERLEVVGAEHIIAKRAKNEEVRRDFLRRIKKAIDDVNKLGTDWIGSQPSMGNIMGGISTIEEKSIGAILKAGTRTLQGCVDYAERPKGKGLYFMDAPGFDVQAVSGLVAGGSHIVLFTTGRGTYLGSPVSPVIKITANPVTVKKLYDAIDVDLSFVLLEVLEKDADINELLERGKKILIEKIMKVANGELTRSEMNGNIEFSIERIGPTA